MGDVIKHDFGGHAQAAEQGAGPSPCRHMSISVSEVERIVSCSTCGAPLDPIRVLLEYARKERHLANWHQEVREAEAKLKALQAEERRTKARLKSASRKEASAAVDEERLRTERMRIEITEKARDIGQMCRRIEQLTRRAT